MFPAMWIMSQSQRVAKAVYLTRQCANSRFGGSRCGKELLPNMPSWRSVIASSCCRGGGTQMAQESLFPFRPYPESCFSEVHASRIRWATSEMMLTLVLRGHLGTCRLAVTRPLLFFAFYSCPEACLAFMSSAWLSKQAVCHLQPTSPPFAGCLSIVCWSALQANICSAVSDATSLLFAQALTSVPWTWCLFHPGVFKQMPSHKGAGFVSAAL